MLWFRTDNPAQQVRPAGGQQAWTAAKSRPGGGPRVFDLMGRALPDLRPSFLLEFRAVVKTLPGGAAALAIEQP